MTAGLLKKKGVCSCCISKKCTNGSSKNKTGNLVKFNCASCNKDKNLPVHQQCFQRQNSQDINSSTPRVPQPRGLSNSSGTGVTAPQLTMVSALPAASVSELRSTSYTSYTVSNPNALGAASELVDICILEGSDGRQCKARVIYDSGATDTVVDFKLASYYHSYESVEYTSRGVNTTRNFATHIGILKILRHDGSYLRIKALKGELSSQAFTMKKKICSPLIRFYVCQA